MRLLDVYCCAGGAAKGYHDAGFDEIVGVDHVEQPRYPYTFVRADACDYVRQYGHLFDAVHASPPCQAYSTMRHVHQARDYPDLIAETREALITTGRPYVIENVVGAPLINPVMLCGTMFGLLVFRHRLFESNLFMLAPPHIPHSAYGRATKQGRQPTETHRYITVTGNFASPNYARAAMGIDWMTRAELSQAIPPAYTQWIGERLLESMAERIVA